MLENLIYQCLDADPLKQPTAGELHVSFDNWWENKNDTEFYKQYKEAEEEFNKSITSKSNIDIVSSSSYTTHPQAIYTSRLLDCKNLPEPQNSKEINIQFYTEFPGNYLLKLRFALFIIFYINDL